MIGLGRDGGPCRVAGWAGGAAREAARPRGPPAGQRSEVRQAGLTRPSPRRSGRPRTRSTRQPVQPATSKSGRTPGRAAGETTMRAPAGNRSQGARCAPQIRARNPDHRASARTRVEDGGDDTDSTGTGAREHRPAPIRVPISIGRRSPGSRTAQPTLGARCTQSDAAARNACRPSSPEPRRSTTISGAESSSPPAGARASHRIGPRRPRDPGCRAPSR